MEQHTEKRKTKARIWAAAAAGLLLILAAGAFALRRPPLHEGLAFSEARFDRRGRLLELTHTPDGKYRLWTPLREVSPLMIRATDLQEQEAPRTLGATPLATSVASLTTGCEARGLRERARLTLAAVKLQALYSREELLEAYLNLAGYGGSIQGVGAASLIYYDKNADQLNLTEALTLSVIPRHPLRRTLTGRPNRDDQEARRHARAQLQTRWRRPGDVTAGPRVSERIQLLRRLVRLAGGGPLVTMVDAGLGRVEERLDQRPLDARLEAGEDEAARLH
jgi:membrane carboxypeptidase/penicillin-binding protein PbpC